MKILLVAILLAWCCCCNALVSSSTFHLRYLTEFTQFGFSPQGSISLSATASPPQMNMSIYICTDKEFDVVTTYSDTDTRRICSNPAVCEYTTDYRTPVNYLVSSKDRYHLLMVQCGIVEDVTVTVSYTLLNPGGEQLPLGQIPLPKLYIFVTCAWICLVALCGINWMRNRTHLVMLHGLLGSVGVLKLAVVIVALSYWSTFQRTGQDVVQLKYLQSFIFALSETAFFCSLLLISKGWRITRSTLPPSEIRTISVALVLLLSTLLFFSFYNDGYYFLSLMIMYFFMLPKIFTSITRNTRALQTHMLLARYANVDLNVEPVLAKMRMFKTLRTAVILYLGSILVISSMKIIMWWFLEWVTSCVSECISIVMIAAICILTRPRENGVFSPRSYFDGPFPILNMQQFDHFDELFGDQIWDPDMVFGNGGALAPPPAPIDMSECLVVEYPIPRGDAATMYYPRIAIAMLEKPTAPSTLRRRATTGGSGAGPSSSSSPLSHPSSSQSPLRSASDPPDVEIVVDNYDDNPLTTSTTSLLPPPSSSSSSSSSFQPIPAPNRSRSPSSAHSTSPPTLSPPVPGRSRGNSRSAELNSLDISKNSNFESNANSNNFESSPKKTTASVVASEDGMQTSSSTSSTSPLVEEGERKGEDEFENEELERTGSDAWLYNSKNK